MQDANNPTHPNQNHSPQDAIPAPQRRSTSKFINNTPPEITLKDKFSAVLKGTQGLILISWWDISGLVALNISMRYSTSLAGESPYFRSY